MKTGFQALMASNKGKGEGIKSSLVSGEGRLYLYDVIGWPFIEAQDVIGALEDIGPVDTLHVHINSPGGDVFEARAIRTAIERHSQNVIVHIDGLAASAASFIMLAGNEIEIAQGAFLMIHCSWGMTVGNKRDHEAQVGVLGKIDNSLAGDYQRRAGGEVSEWLAAMEAETWLSADEAVAQKLVDRVFDGKVEARFNLSAFANTPKALGGEMEKITAEENREITVSLKLDDPHGLADEGPDGFLARMSSRITAALSLAPKLPEYVDGARASLAEREAEIADREAKLT